MSSAFSGSPTNYRVVVQPTSTTNFQFNALCNNLGNSDRAGCFFLDIASKTATQFTIELRQVGSTSGTAALVNANSNLVLDWIALPTN